MQKENIKMYCPIHISAMTHHSNHQMQMKKRYLILLVDAFQKRAILKAKNESFNQIIFNNYGNERQKQIKGHSSRLYLL